MHDVVSELGRRRMAVVASAILGFLLMGAGIGSAQDEVTLTPVGHFGGWMASIAVPPGTANYLYAGEGSGLCAWDVQNPEHPTLAGGLPLQGTDVNSIGFSATGQVAYVTNGVGVQVVSLADPAHPALLGGCPTTGHAHSLAVANSSMVLAATTVGWDDGRIRTVSVADPANPAEVGGYDTPGSAQSVWVAGSRAYVADGAAGVVVLDIVTPTTPTLLGTYNTPGTAWKVQVVGTVAYVADGTGGFHLLNVANPSAIALLATCETDSDIRDLQVTGTTAYAVDNATGNLHVLNVATLTAPVRVANVDLGWDASRIGAKGNFVYVASGEEGLMVVDVATPSSPTVVSTYARPSNPRGIAGVGSTVYLVDESRVWLCDFSEPSSPRVMGMCELGHSSFGEPPPRVSVADTMAAVAKQEYGMVMVDVADAGNPTVVGRLAIPAGRVATDVWRGGTVACLLTQGGHGRLHVIDIADPAAPQELGTVDTPGDGRRLSVLNGVAYVADGAGGVRIIDIGAPSAPAEIGHIDPPAGTSVDVAMAAVEPSTGQPRLFVVYNGAGDGRVRSYDVAAPAAPVLVAASDVISHEIRDLDQSFNRVHLAGSYVELSREELQALLEYYEDYYGAFDLECMPMADGRIRVHIILGSSGVKTGESSGPGQLARIEVAPGSDSLQIGETQHFAAQGYDAENNEVPLTPTWKTTGGQIDQNGVYTATEVGSFTITATAVDGGPEGTATATVIPEVAEIQVTPPETLITQGESVQYDARVVDALGNLISLMIRWSTSAGEISQTGQYTATQVGDHTVTASVDGSPVVGTATVHVSPATVEQLPGAADSFTLSQNHPNPCRGVSMIEFGVPEPCHVTLTVHDLHGRQVATLIDQSCDPGAYRAMFDGGALPSGLYLYRMRANRFEASRLMVVLSGGTPQER